MLRVFFSDGGRWVHLSVVCSVALCSASVSCADRSFPGISPDRIDERIPSVSSHRLTCLRISTAASIAMPFQAFGIGKQ